MDQYQKDVVKAYAAFCGVLVATAFITRIAVNVIDLVSGE